jgi:hypothetical protein
MFAFSSFPSKPAVRSSRLASALSAAALVALGAALCGCEVPLAMMIAGEASHSDGTPVVSNEGSSDPYGGDYSSGYSALQVQNASVHGDLGDALGFSGSPHDVDAEDGDGMSTITLWVGGDGEQRWETMTQLTFYGGLGSTKFQPGSHIHSTGSYTSDPSVTAWGCSGTGASASELAYEADSTELDLDVSAADKPGMVHVAFTITYNDSQVVQGELDVSQPLSTH